MRQRQNIKKVHAPSKRTFKRRLTKSGYSEGVTDNVWQWYHPPKKKPE